MNRNRLPSSNRLAIFFFASILLFLPGCGKQVEDWVAGIERLPSLTPPVSLKPVAASEFVSGSRPYSQTIQRGYYTSAAVGGLASEVVQTSTTHSYKVYSSVQGVLISEDPHY